MRRRGNLTLQKDVMMYANEKPTQYKKSYTTTTCSGKKDGYGGVPTWEKTAMTPSANNYDLSFMNVDWKKTMFGQ